MKRLLAMLLALMLFCSAALAEEGLVFEISGITVQDEWAGETSDTHKWIAVNGTLTNWGAKSIKLSKNISAELSFQGSHEFKAETEFGMSKIEPLVQAEGALVFKVPNMVAEAGSEELEITLTVQGEKQQLSPEGIRRSGSYRSGKLEGPGFDSPQAAVEAYVEAFNRGDMPAMLSTFAIETYVDNVDTQAYVERVSAAYPSSPETIPIGNEYFRDVKVALRYGDIADELFRQYLFHNTPEAYADLANGYSLPMYASETEKIPDYIAAMSDVPMTGWFGKIELVKFLDPGDLHEMYLDESNLKSIDRQRVTYGCDELVDVPVLLNIDCEEYLLIMQCARYGDRWFNYSLTGNLTFMMNLDIYSGGLGRCADVL